LRRLSDELLDLSALVERWLSLGETDELLQVDTIDEFTKRCRHAHIGGKMQSCVRDRSRGILTSMKEPDPVGVRVHQVLIDIVATLDKTIPQLLAEESAQRGLSLDASLIDERDVVRSRHERYTLKHFAGDLLRDDTPQKIIRVEKLPRSIRLK
jgi:hypothetical protein